MRLRFVLSDMSEVVTEVPREQAEKIVEDWVEYRMELDKDARIRNGPGQSLWAVQIDKIIAIQEVLQS
jgi:hypothetical protein